jgi:hypothetical protein
MAVGETSADTDPDEIIMVMFMVKNAEIEDFLDVIEDHMSNTSVRMHGAMPFNEVAKELGPTHSAAFEKRQSGGLFPD